MGEGTALTPQPPIGSVVWTARVDTGRPSPYLLQLCKHFRHKREATFDEVRGTIVFEGAMCLLVAAGGALVLRVDGASENDVRRVAEIVGSHLERFGKKDGLQVRWAPMA